jgi:FkbM family methyltransferase
MDDDLARAIALIAGFDWKRGDIKARDDAIAALYRSDLETAVVKLRNGAAMRIRLADKVIARKIADEGRYEPAVATAIERILRPGDCFIDVGANIGCHAITAARRVGVGGHVLAFEPNKANRAELCANLELNSLANVLVWPCGLGTAVRTHRMQADPSNPGGAKIADDCTDNFEPVQVAPLDLMRPARTIRLVKIDVEGYELQVLEGARGLFGAEDAPACVLEYNAERYEEEEWRRLPLFEYFSSLGWNIYTVSEMDGALTFNLHLDPYIAEDFVDIVAIPPRLQSEIIGDSLLLVYDHQAMRAQYSWRRQPNAP